MDRNLDLEPSRRAPLGGLIIHIQILEIPSIGLAPQQMCLSSAMQLRVIHCSSLPFDVFCKTT